MITITSTSGAIGLLAGLHIVSDWVAFLLPADAPIWLVECVSYTAIIVLIIATWFAVPTFYNAINSGIRRALLIVIERIIFSLQALAAPLRKRKDATNRFQRKLIDPPRQAKQEAENPPQSSAPRTQPRDP